MPKGKNLCALIPTEMHDRVCREREKLGMTNSDYVLKVLTEYYDMMENGGTDMAKKKGEERTLAFQVSEELFQRVKRYLERERARTKRKLTQKDFVIGLIEAKLDEADREDAESEAAKKAEIEAGGNAEDSQSADVEPAMEEPESTQSENAEAAEDSQPTDAEPDTQEPEDSGSENGETAEDSQSADAEPATEEPEDSESENGKEDEDNAE